MSTSRSSATNIDSYIAEFPAEVAAILTQVRSTIAREAPDAVETISYAIPTFDLNGGHLVHFAGFAKHVGFYPGAEAVVEFANEFAHYKHATGSVQFPLDQPMPLELIRRVVAYRVAVVKAGGR